MGMFDSVYVDCPNCEKLVELQTKQGECLCKTYNLINAPPEVLLGVEGEHECDRAFDAQTNKFVDGCGQRFTVVVQCITKAWVEMTKEEEEY